MTKSTWAQLAGVVYDLLTAFVLPHLPTVGPLTGTIVGTALKVVIDDFFPGTV